MKNIKILSYILIISIVFISCEIDISYGGGDDFVPKKENVQEVSNEVKEQISDLIFNQVPDGSYQSLSLLDSILPEINNSEFIDTAYINGISLFITFTDGSRTNWFFPLEPVELPPVTTTGFRSPPSNLIGNTKILLIQGSTFDPIKENAGSAGENIEKSFNTITPNLRSLGYEVDIVNNNDASIDFLESNLNKYGAIFIGFHGGYNVKDDIFFLRTGQNYSKDKEIEYKERYGKDVYKEIIYKSNSIEISNGKKIVKEYFGISNKFFEKLYTKNSFPNSFIYMASCQTLKGDVMGETLNELGVEALIGWTESNSIGGSVGVNIFSLMSVGYSVEEAYDILPNFNKVEDRDNDALLSIYKTSNLNLKFTDNTSNVNIIVSNLDDGETIKNRAVRIEGLLSNLSSVESAVIIVNNKSIYEVEASQFAFSSDLIIESGENSISIIISGWNDKGDYVLGEKRITVFGEFAVPSLWTHLYWNTNNTDVDIHLLPPNTTEEDLWSSVDCYYKNKNTSWNSHLDIDDIDGYGPEHITITELTNKGVYKLYVHYYDDYKYSSAPTKTTAFVDIGTKTNLKHLKLNLIIDSADFLYYGDLYHVANITLPSGEIELIPADKGKINLGLFRNSIFKTNKK